MAELPTGTVTFLFTDIEGSTRLWELHPEAMRLALARHYDLMTALIEQQGGVVVKRQGEGDSVFAVFAAATDAVTAAGVLQQALRAEPWPAETPLRVRMALHTGEAELRDGDYFGPPVNRCARLRAIAHGGQVVLSQATADRVETALPAGASLRDLGSHRLKDLQQPEHLHQLLHPFLPADFPPLRSLQAFAHNLPAQLTSFIGREEAMAEVKQFLTTTRLLTVTGSGGCGKTRLALQVAAELLEEHADGVWLVELAPLADPALVPRTAASTLGLREEPGRPITETLTDYLRSRSLLLVLDNCEHLLAASAQLADSLLRACPKLCILASSREALGIAGERTYRVPSLSLPGEGVRCWVLGVGTGSDPSNTQHLTPNTLLQSEAVRLFSERAAFAQRGFALSDRNAAAVAQVCHRLDGIPLALELAAARVKALSVEQLNARLDDMFRLLTGGSRTALPRQQTLRALIDWSHDLLTEPERALLRRLSVFAGGWTLDAAEAVCSGVQAFRRSGIQDRSDPSDPSDRSDPERLNARTPERLNADDVLDLLTSLVEKSLVLYEERDGEGRYRLLETVRQYARDRMSDSGEAEPVRDRHLDYIVRVAEQAESERHGPEQAAWRERLEREHDNLRAALAWGLDSQPEKALRIAGALGWFWDSGGHRLEGSQWLERALERAFPFERTEAQAIRWRWRALYWASGLAGLRLGELDRAKALAEECLALSREQGDPEAVAGALMILGRVASSQGDYERARVVLEEALALYRDSGNNGRAAAVLTSMGMLATSQGEYAAARRFLDESLRLNRRLGNKAGIANILCNQGTVAVQQGEYDEALRLAAEGMALYQELKDQGGIGLWLAHKAHVARARGEMAAARRLYRESLAIFRQLREKEPIARCLEGLAAVEATEGQHSAERAAQLFGAAEALRDAMRAPLLPADRAERDRSVPAVRSALGEAAFAAAWAEGRALSTEAAIAGALEEAADV